MKAENQKLKYEIAELKAGNKKRESLMEKLIDTHVMTIELRNSYREQWNAIEKK